jgi:hypothetical protein
MPYARARMPHPERYVRGRYPRFHFQFFSLIFVRPDPCSKRSAASPEEYVSFDLILQSWSSPSFEREDSEVQGVNSFAAKLFS